MKNERFSGLILSFPPSFLGSVAYGLELHDTTTAGMEPFLGDAVASL